MSGGKVRCLGPIQLIQTAIQQFNSTLSPIQNDLHATTRTAHGLSAEFRVVPQLGAKSDTRNVRSDFTDRSHRYTRHAASVRTVRTVLTSFPTPNTNPGATPGPD